MSAKLSLKLDKSLCDRARRAAEAAGYSSVEEFIEHVIEKELLSHESPEAKEELTRRLKGLGYIE
jgi:hypothetical protein